VENMAIRKLKKEDAEEISTIYGAITMKPVSTDFKRVVEEHAQRDDEACFVAERNGPPVSACPRVPGLPRWG
jgi:hypothetical protein